MAKSREEVVKGAQSFYVSEGYGTLPNPLTGENLAQDKNFCEFFEKYETAYNYYSTTGFPEFLINSQMAGIDFNGPVDKVVIPKGQTQIQTQVAWGMQGNYYSDSTYTPQDMGISDQGKAYNPLFVPSHKKDEFEIQQKKNQQELMQTIGKSDEDYDKNFPALQRDGPKIELPEREATIIYKKTRTYEASEDIIALQSTAKPVKDTWSVPGKEIDCKGGGMQLFVSPSENSKMQLKDYGAHDEPEQNVYNKPSKT